MPPPSPKQNMKFGVGGGTYPQSQGCGAGVCAPPTPSSIPVLPPLQIPCSLVVAKLISNSCAPPPPLLTRLMRNEKGSPSPKAAAVLGLCYWGIRVVSAVGRFGLVVSAKFWGESIRPILVGRFGRESFRPWVVSAHVGDTLHT